MEQLPQIIPIVPKLVPRY